MPFRYIDFVVTGTPRSGTSYMSSLLRELGYDCAHERCFDPWHVTFAEERADTCRWGDSSWLAVPYLEDLPPSTRVVHVVRNPVDSINSIIGTGQLDWPHDYRAFIAHHWRGNRDWWPAELSQPGQEFWRDWNARIECSGRVHARVKLEAIADEIEALVSAIDPDRVIDPKVLDAATTRLTRDINARPHLHGCPVVTLDSLDDRTRVQAQRYGYDS
jgi:hypothetical protein